MEEWANEMVKRFDKIVNQTEDGFTTYMQEREDGDYVIYEDYEKLEQRIKELEGALDTVHGILTDDWDGLTPEDCRKDIRSYVAKVLKVNNES